MKINNINIRLEEGVELPIHSLHPALSVPLRVNKILKLFKGDEEITGIRLAKAQEGFKRGYIKLRAFERILFGTGIYVDLSEDTELQIRATEDIILNQGLTILNNIKHSSIEGEIQLIVYNGTPYLTPVSSDDILATATIVKVDNLLRFNFPKNEQRLSRS